MSRDGKFQIRGLENDEVETYGLSLFFSLFCLFSLTGDDVDNDPGDDEEILLATKSSTRRSQRLYRQGNQLDNLKGLRCAEVDEARR